MPTKKKYEKPLAIDVPFDEALERYAGVDPPEVAEAMKSGPTEERVPLIEDEDTGHRFLLYETADDVRAEILFEGNSFWMSQAQMAETFGVERSVITKHVGNVFREGEVREDGNVQKLHISSTKPTNIYSLHVLLSVGFRVGGKGTQFRIWALDKLVQILTKGFYIDKRLMKGQPDRIAELREIIRDIRADEANVYAELRRMCALCSDYDPKSDAAHKFYAHMQAKLYWAVVSHTAAEVLRERIDANHPTLGLQTWGGEKPLQADALNAKNTLTPTELKELNRVHDILLSVFEDQLDVGRLTTMKDAERLLDEQLAQLGRPVLRHGGSISSDDAKAHAKAQYKIFDERRRLARKARADAELAELKKSGKTSKAASKKIDKKG